MNPMQTENILLFGVASELRARLRRGNPVSILFKSIAGRYRPVRVADGPITTRYRFIKNANWERGWLGEANVSCILRHRGVQLILAYCWTRPAILAAGKVEGVVLFLLFLHFHSFSSFSPVPLFHLLYYLFSFSLGDDTKWPTRIDVSLNTNTINRRSKADLSPIHPPPPPPSQPTHGSFPTDRSSAVPLLQFFFVRVSVVSCMLCVLSLFVLHLYDDIFLCDAF